MKYTRAWSLGGFGFVFGWWMLLFFILCIIFGAFIIYFKLTVVLQVVNWILSILAASFCANEVLYAFNLPFLKKTLFWRVRVNEILSVLIGVGLACGWWFTELIWPLNNVISICIMTMAIKLIKFTSMQWAGSYMFFLLIIEVISTTVLNVTLK